MAKLFQCDLCGDLWKELPEGSQRAEIGVRKVLHTHKSQDERGATVEVVDERPAKLYVRVSWSTRDGETKHICPECMVDVCFRLHQEAQKWRGKRVSEGGKVSH